MPFFIVASLKSTMEFYLDRLGFEIDFATSDFAIVRRDRVAIMLKELGPEARPLPNQQRHAWARWDAYIYSPDPHLLFEEFRERNAEFHRPISDTDDGLRAFEIQDCNGYVICFGRPR